MLTRHEADEITADRFERWRKGMEAIHATPVMVIGIRHPDDEPIVMANDHDRETLANILEAARKAIGIPGTADR